MSSAWNDLHRPPLRGGDLHQRLLPQWRVTVVDEIDSTQQRVRDLARSGAPAGEVVIAEYQSAGRGRRDRTWVSPPRAGVTMSLLLRPDQISPWVGFTVAAAAASAINAISATPIALKWPNDLLLNDRKVGGVIAEVEGDAVVVGLGLNVSTGRDELPLESATSLALEGIQIDREILIKAILREVDLRLAADLNSQRSLYRTLLSTLGRQVKVIGVNSEYEGLAERVDDSGELVVDGRSFAIGDVVHLR